MASLSGTSQEQRRWLVVGIALQQVLTPCLRDKIKSEMTPFYQQMVRNFGLDKQMYPSYKKSIPPSWVNLNYGSVNNNSTLHRNPRHYDYCVKDEVSLAKLFMKPFMAQFNAFDSSFDTSAALAVLCGVSPSTSVKRLAEDVRSKVRNEWAHCNFTVWNEAHYDTCFDLMEALVTNLRFSPVDETKLLGEIRLWKTHGLSICLGKPLDDALLQIVHKEVQRLSNSLACNKEEHDENIHITLDLFKSELDRAIVSLQEKQSSLEITCDELKCNQATMKDQISTKDKEQKMHWEITQEMQIRCNTLDVKSSIMQAELDLLTATVSSMSPPEDFNHIVFDAPVQSKWFTGREKEIESLEKCLPLNKGLKMSVLCGLGGCGKTTLASYFSWKRKHEYDGGVFWISMENDGKFEDSVNDLALRIGIEASSFDLTLSKLLAWISQRKKPWLLVLDDVDQLNLSEQMHKILSGRWQRQASGHVLLTTRREPKEVCKLIEFDPSCCVEVFAFSEEEAMRFLVSRCGTTATGNEIELDELVRELGCLPLALEQAGAHIKALQCPISSYLEEYKKQQLNLLNKNPRAKPSWEYESKNRLAVHTTWLLNFEYVRKSPQGELTSTFLNAAAFLAPNEIEEELINSQLLPCDDPVYKNCNFLLLKRQIIDILTKFSLFQRKSRGSLRLHRLVQEVIRNRMTNEETASSLLRAVQLLHQSFRDCPSPDRILNDITASEQKQPSASLTDPSLFYLWSKLTIHVSELQQHLRALLDQQSIRREVKAVILTRETSRILYEYAIQLSVHGHQVDAKEAERFAFQIFDSCTSDGRPLSTEDLRKLFPHYLPLPPLFQKTVLYSSRPLEYEKFADDERLQSAATDEIRLQGNALFKEGNFKEAVETYTKAIKASEEGTHTDPRLLNNRATAYLKLGNFNQCLHDSEEYIKMMPTCWKGYTRKALALNGLGLSVSALCSAAIAYYHDTISCRQYPPFTNVFNDLDKNWQVVDSSEALKRYLRSNRTERSRKEVLLLKNAQYDIGLINITNTTLAALDNTPDVTINCEQPSLCSKCFVQNIAFSAKQSIHVQPDGKVEFHKCTFRNCTSDAPVISIYGSVTFIECTVKDSKGSGIGVMGPNSSAVLLKCEISGNGRIADRPYSFGIRVFGKGRLLVHECHIFGNVRGIWLDEGPMLGIPAKEAIITDTEIYDNKYEGIVVGGSPRLSHDLPVVIMRRNKIYHNGTFGVRATLNINYILFEGNMVFENLWWGVCVHNNSGGVYTGNEICNNKMGGIIVGKQSPGKPPCVVENNFIHDNCGPAFYEGLRPSERDSFPKELHIFFQKASEMVEAREVHCMRWDVFFPDMVHAKLNSNQCIQNDQGQKHFKAAALKTHCVFCFRRDIDLKPCKRCKTATYCGKQCQKLHWGKHKYTCEATGQRNAVELPLSTDTYCMVTIAHPGLQPSGPDYAPPPLRDGSRFIVKIQTYEAGFYGDIIDMRGFVSEHQDPNEARMVIYDRSRHITFNFNGKPQLYHLIMECGMMGKSMSLTKKLYCWAAFKDPKTLRIFTHEFPEVQEW